jgi:hypothetical protein
LNPGGSAMTRRDTIKPGMSITPLRPGAQRSAWLRDLLYGGGLGVVALVLALSFSVVRPTPRRRRPELPAPAQCNAWRRRG